MQFCIKHLLVATFVVAIFAMGLVKPSPVMEAGFTFAAWLMVAMLVVRGICYGGREGKVIACGLFVALSYLSIALWFWMPIRFPTTMLLERLYPKYTFISAPAGSASNLMAIDNEHHDNFRAIGEYAFGAIFGLLAGGLAAYWTRPSGGVVENT